MKILFVIDILGSGGKERRLTELLKALRLRKEVDFELVVMSETIYYTEVLDLGINIHKIIRKTKKDFAVFGKFYRLIRNYRPDIVHCWEGMTAIYAAPVCALLPCKFVNGMVTNSPLRRNILNSHWLRARLTFPLSQVIVSNSKAGLSAYRAPAGRSTVIRNGFNFERVNNLAGQDVIRKELNITTEFIVGMVASFWKQKDYPTYYRAAQLLLEKRRDVTFLAIGPNTDSEESARLIDGKNTGNFRLLGKMSGIESYINVMDICVLSTFTEGLSNSVLEYMALGKPVIATKGGGTGEIVKDNETGFLINPSNPEELTNKIELLLNDQRLRIRMGSAGKERIKSEFSIDQMVGEYIGLYAKLTLN